MCRGGRWRRCCYWPPNDTEGLLKEPKPFIRQKSLADFAVNYELNAYCGDASQMMKLYTEMHRNIQDVFNENGVQIMSPAYKGPGRTEDRPEGSVAHAAGDRAGISF